VGQGSELSVLNYQKWGKKLNSQHQTLSDACIKQKRLRAGVGQQANHPEVSTQIRSAIKAERGRQTNLPEEPPVLRRD
jgi:hypothetical protein